MLRYRCVNPSLLRESAEMKSKKMGKLRKGVVVEVLEQHTLETGVVRLRTPGGWASESAADGTVILQREAPEPEPELELEPEPEPEPEPELEPEPEPEPAKAAAGGGWGFSGWLGSAVETVKAAVDEVTDVPEADKDLKRKDHDVTSCSACDSEFGLLNRKHHCRECHGVFCGACSGKRHEGKRVCDNCHTQLTQPKMTAEHVRRLFSRFASADDDAAEPRLGQDQLSALSIATGSTAIDDDYWRDTCDALGAQAADGLAAKDLEGLYLGDGAWAANLAADYATVFGDGKDDTAAPERLLDQEPEELVVVELVDDSPLVEISVTTSNDVLQSDDNQSPNEADVQEEEEELQEEAEEAEELRKASTEESSAPTATKSAKGLFDEVSDDESDDGLFGSKAKAPPAGGLFAAETSDADVEPDSDSDAGAEEAAAAMAAAKAAAEAAQIEQAAAAAAAKAAQAEQAAAAAAAKAAADAARAAAELEAKAKAKAADAKAKQKAQKEASDSKARALKEEQLAAAKAAKAEQERLKKEKLAADKAAKELQEKQKAAAATKAQGQATNSTLELKLSSTASPARSKADGSPSLLERMQAASPRPEPGTPNIHETKKKLAAKTAEGKRQKKLADEAKARGKEAEAKQQAASAAAATTAAAEQQKLRDAERQKQEEKNGAAPEQAPVTAPTVTSVARSKQAYVCVKASLLRQGCDMKSKKVGQLKKGEAVQVFEQATLPNGVVRMHIARGWASAKTADGTVVLRRQGDKAEPAAESSARKREERLSKLAPAADVAGADEGAGNAKTADTVDDGVEPGLRDQELCDFDKRILREKQERYEASDEYKELMAKQKTERENVALAEAAQISEGDVKAGLGDARKRSVLDAARWISAVLDDPSLTEQLTKSAAFSEDDEEHGLQAVLKSGVVLCQLVNAIAPGSVAKVSASAQPFPQRENVKAFIDNIRKLGVPDSENFETDDLFAAKNMKQVLIALHSFGRHAASVEGYTGPSLTVKGGGLAATSSAGDAAAARSGKVRSLSARLKIPTGAAARIVEPGSVEWLELQRGAAYTPGAGSPAAAAGVGGGAAASALAGVMMGGGGGGSSAAQRSTSVEEAGTGVESSTAKDATNSAAKQRAKKPSGKTAPTRGRRPKKKKR